MAIGKPGFRAAWREALFRMYVAEVCIGLADFSARRVTLRRAHRSDFVALLADPLPCRVRAIAGEVDGQTLAIGGVAYLPDGTITAFLQASDRARRYPVSLHRAALMILAEAKRLRIPRVIAIAEEGVEPARRWLGRLGFAPADIGGQEVWIWNLRSRSD